MLSCLVVDDELTTMDHLVRLLRANPSVARICTARDGAGALRLLQRVEVDVALLEVRMPGMDGIELASVLRRFGTPPALVFVTRCPDRAPEAFRLGAVAYLRKPPRPERVAAALGRVSARRTGPERPEADPMSVRVEQGATTRLLCASTVRWAQASGDYVRLHTAEGDHLVRARMAALADDWRRAGMVRIHRSYLVQLRHVAEVRQAGSGRLTVVVDGHRLPVSRRFAPALRSQLGAVGWG